MLANGVSVSGWLRAGLLLAILVPGLACGQTRTDLLRACLSDFGGMEWKLPYRPPLRVRSCASPAASFDTVESTVGGRRSIVFSGELTLGPGHAGWSPDENYAALQSVVLQHFEKQFLLRGYRRTAIEHGNARTGSDPFTECLRRWRRGKPLCREEDYPPQPPQPPIPFVSLARYVLGTSGREVVLTYAVEAKNAWRVTLEGVSAAPEPTAGKQ